MRPADLQDIVDAVRTAGTDTATVEVKSGGGGVGKSLWPTISAFSNTHGGVVILGLDEATGFTPAPGFDARRVLNQMADVARPSWPVACENSFSLFHVSPPDLVKQKASVPWGTDANGPWCHPG